MIDVAVKVWCPDLGDENDFDEIDEHYTSLPIDDPEFLAKCYVERNWADSLDHADSAEVCVRMKSGDLRKFTVNAEPDVRFYVYENK